MKEIFTSIVFLGLLVIKAIALDTKTNDISKNAIIKAKQEAESTQLIKEAIRAIQYTQDALFYLNNNKNKQAAEIIKKAINELNIVLNTPNTPYLLPVDIHIKTYTLLWDIKKVNSLITQAKILVNENKIPQAREILNSLRNEIVIKTINLPLVTYPAALKLAIKYLNEKKIDETKDVLTMALSTLVEIDSIIPIPLIKAQALVEEAAKMIKKNKDQTLKYLKEAKNQLNLAEKLGYNSTSETTYQALKNEIMELENKIHKNNETLAIFSDLIQKIKEFKEKAISVIHK
jgi:tetratricopeptide (TPR) repeat protein